jgi:hypothetical protein
MIAAPKTMPQAIEQAMGMPSDLIRKAGLSFFVKYKGFSDKEQLEDYFNKLSLLYSVQACFSVADGSSKIEDTAPIIIDKLFRGTVLPNMQNIRCFYETL